MAREMLIELAEVACRWSLDRMVQQYQDLIEELHARKRPDEARTKHAPRRELHVTGQRS